MPSLSAEEAATRLGIKKETLYAYVSRGMLESRRDRGGRSRFDAAEVERLAVRSRKRSGGVDVAITSGITLLRDNRCYFRGVDAVALAGANPFEAVVEWLWTGSSLSVRRLVAPEGVVRTAAACVDALPDTAGVVDRLRVSVAAASASDPLRHDLRADSVRLAGRRVIGTMIDALGGENRLASATTSPESSGQSAARRLWDRLTGRPPVAADTAFLDTALGLMCDHDLATSTLAARVAASGRADPYSVVGAGLGALGGVLHGGAGTGVYDLLEEIGAADRAAAVIGNWLAEGRRIPGFGHSVYTTDDPRAVALLDLAPATAVAPERWQVVESVVAVSRSRSAVPVNVDLALAGFCWAAGLPRDASEAVFAVARTAGWIAHAIEEYEERPLRFRPRALYSGVEP
ncbi:MAG: 2-methylcitrate synthase 1 [Acidimicrobiales bacterium]|nr:MAG: citrate/2-methylcitrate synthase [Actinomycetota bacterium]MBV6509898.1 2-methylcitrate synthase 1 [Acidimicrobiales bacterium]RIK03284.1 MAG: citrate synthase [Acidobacteriota bacterium]